MIREIFMGCKSKDSLPLLAEKYASTMRTDPRDIWVKVVDNDTREIVGASNWKVYVNGVSGSDTTSDATVPAWLEEDEAEEAKKLLVGVNEARRRAMAGHTGYIRQLRFPTSLYISSLTPLPRVLYLIPYLALFILFRYSYVSCLQTRC
jgi:hypothetical protein